MNKLKLILTAFVIVCFATKSFPQDKAESKTNLGSDYRWEIGLNGGVNFTNVNGFNHNNIQARNGRLYGGTLIYHFSKMFAFKTDIDFENKGWTLNSYTADLPDINGNIQNLTTNLNQELDYFDIPAFLHIGFGNRFKFDLNLGSYFAFLMNNRTFYTDATGKEIDVVLNELSNYKSFDFGLTYGAGIDYVLSKRISVGFDVLVEQGLAPLQEGSDIKNQSLDFDIGINYLFHKKKK